MKTKYLYYPGHGIGEITGRENKVILGVAHEFLRMTIINTGMHVIVPTLDTERSSLDGHT